LNKPIRYNAIDSASLSIKTSTASMKLRKTDPFLPSRQQRSQARIVKKIHFLMKKWFLHSQKTTNSKGVGNHFSCRYSICMSAWKKRIFTCLVNVLANQSWNFFFWNIRTLIASQMFYEEKTGV